MRERVAANDAAGAARLARRISDGLLTRAYRERPSEWDPHAEMSVDEVVDIMPPGLEGSERRRPYCEVLFVSAQPAARWPALADEVRGLRRPEDEFVSVGGIGVGTFGASAAELVGRAYNLRSPYDLVGTYTAVGAGAAVVGGIRATRLRNANGVVLELQGGQVGLQLNVGVSGATITMP